MPDAEAAAVELEVAVEADAAPSASAETKDDIYFEGVSEVELAELRIIFDVIDADHSGTISWTEIGDACDSLGEKDSATRWFKRSASGTKLAIQESTAAFTFKEFVEEMTMDRKRSLVGQFALFLLLWVMPALYAFSTRLTFIFLALEVTTKRADHTGGLDPLLVVSLLLGGYQTCRALANAIIGAWGVSDPFRKFFLPQAILAGTGWLLNALVEHNGSPWMLYMLCLVGISETVVTLQVAVLKETRNDSPSGGGKKTVQSQRLRYQYISVSLGAGLAFIIGGAVYSTTDFTTTCWLGFSMNVANIIAGAIYYCIGARDDPVQVLPEADGESNKLEISLGGRRLSTSLPLGTGSYSHKNSTSDAVESLKCLSYKFAAVRALADAASNMEPSASDLSAGLQNAQRDLAMTDYLIELATDMKAKFGGKLGKEALTCMLNLVTPSAERDTPKQSALVTTLCFLISNADHADAEISIEVDELVSFLLPRTYLKLHPTAASEPREVYFYLKVVVVTQAVMALCIGTFLSTALLYYNDVYSYDAGSAGVVLGCGELVAVIFMLGVSACAKFQEMWLKRVGVCQLPATNYQSFVQLRLAQVEAFVQLRLAQVEGVGSSVSASYGQMRGHLAAIFTRPLHVPVIVTVVGLLTIGYTGNSLGASIACQLLFSGLNDFSVSLLNELTAASTPPSQFQGLQAFGQTLRRFGNCLTAFTGPVLFGIDPKLPFLLYGGIVVSWALLFLWTSIYLHAVKITRGLSQGCFPPSTVFRHFTPQRPWHVWEQEYNSATLNTSVNTGSKSMTYTIARLQATVRSLNEEVAALKSFNLAGSTDAISQNSDDYPLIDISV